MKILVISRSPWDDTNSFGNTFSNFFSRYPKKDIAHLYLRPKMPSNNVCSKYFRMSDKEIIRTIFRRKINVGELFELSEKESVSASEKEHHSDERLHNFFKQHNSYFALIGQDILWALGTWRSRSLKRFLDDFKPDVIFVPSSNRPYVHRLLWFVHEYTGAKIAVFHADDYLSTNFSLNIFKVWYQFMRKKHVMKTISKAAVNYCISKVQKEEYEKKTNSYMKLLYKGHSFNEFSSYDTPPGNQEINMTYIGSIAYGRWETLSLLSQTIKKINREYSKTVFVLSIYSQDKFTRKISKEVLNDYVKFKGKAQQDEIRKLYKDSDLVLHVESFKDKHKKKTRLSFSTKIVDLLNTAKPVIAIGPSDIASIRYLKDHDSAIIIDNPKLILQSFKMINLNRDSLGHYAQKAWNLGFNNHDQSKIQHNLFRDFSDILD